MTLKLHAIFFESCLLLIPAPQFKISLSWSFSSSVLTPVFRCALPLLYKYFYPANATVSNESELLFCHHPIPLSARQKDLFPFLLSVTGTQMDHIIGLSSAFPRDQSRLCDLCSWQRDHPCGLLSDPSLQLSVCLMIFQHTLFNLHYKGLIYASAGRECLSESFALVTEISHCLWDDG